MFHVANPTGNSETRVKLPRGRACYRTAGGQSGEEGAERVRGKNGRRRGNIVGDRGRGGRDRVQNPSRAPVDGTCPRKRRRRRRRRRRPGVGCGGPVGCVPPRSEAVRVVQGVWRRSGRGALFSKSRVFLSLPGMGFKRVAAGHFAPPFALRFLFRTYQIELFHDRGNGFQKRYVFVVSERMKMYGGANVKKSIFFVLLFRIVYLYLFISYSFVVTHMMTIRWIVPSSLRSWRSFVVDVDC